MNWDAKRLGAALVLLTSLQSTGCQTEVVEDRPRPLVRTNGKAFSAPNLEGPLSPDVLAATDPCATRLADVSGFVLEYYVTHGHQMPPQLEDVARFVTPGTIADFTCPATRQPYTYVSQGLPDLTDAYRMILFDSVPEKDGLHWCVIVKQPMGRDLITNVVHLNEAQFHVYAPAK